MPRKTSDVTDTQFPFDEDTTPFILVFNIDNSASGDVIARIEDKDFHRGYAAAWTLDKKRDLVELAGDLEQIGVNCTLLATWPGAESTHVFEVDDLNEARGALA